MAAPEVDCSRINELIREINHTNQEIAATIAEMERLGFGTAKLARIIKATYKFAQLLETLVPGIWHALYDYVRCQDDRLATLTVSELKKLLEVLAAHAELQLESLDDTDMSPENKKLRADLTEWLRRINAELAAWNDTRAKADAIAALKALKAHLQANAPRILTALKEAFADDILEHLANRLTSRKALIKKITKRVVIFALGSAVAGKVNPFVGIALTGWELLVELSGGAAVGDLRAYLDKLLTELVVLYERCYPGWPFRNDPNKGPPTVYVPGVAKYNGASVTVRPLVRCAQIVDGKPVWGPPCALVFDNGRPAGVAFITLNMTDQNRVNGRWEIPTKLRAATLQNSPCMKNAKYCYTYIEFSFTFPDGTKSAQALIVGVKTF